MSMQKYTKEACILLLKVKYAELQANSDDRYPKKSDFTEEEVSYIKAYLGPWPRALEQAEIKPLRDDCVKEKRLEKRILAKRRKTQAKIRSKQNGEPSLPRQTDK